MSPPFSAPDPLLPLEPSISAKEMCYGLIAGWGHYPLLLAEAIKRSGKRVACLGIFQHADPQLEKICDYFQWAGIGRLSSGCRFFRNHGVTQATLAGKFHKHLLFQPGYLWRQIPDFYTLKMFAPHFGQMFLPSWLFHHQKTCKDDSLLLTVVESFQNKGITLLPGTNFAPELLVERKLLTRRAPTPSQWKDIWFGWTLAREMGRLDVGQSVCVKNQAVLAVEAIEGTDEAIRRAGSLCQRGGFTIVKVAKPQQDMRFDVPTIGLKTLQTMAESGASVLAVEANKTILVDRSHVIEFANEHKIAIVAVVEEDTHHPETAYAQLTQNVVPLCTKPASLPKNLPSDCP